MSVCNEVKRESFVNDLISQLESLNKSLLDCEISNRNTLDRFRGTNPESDCEKSPEPTIDRDKISQLVQLAQKRADECLRYAGEYDGIL